jgi:hypothetical protein
LIPPDPHKEEFEILSRIRCGERVDLEIIGAFVGTVVGYEGKASTQFSDFGTPSRLGRSLTLPLPILYYIYCMMLCLSRSGMLISVAVNNL